MLSNANQYFNGQEPARHGVTQWLPGKTTWPNHSIQEQKVLCPQTHQHIEEREHTLAETLQDAGYTTALLGKWHMGAIKSTGGPKNHGFDFQQAVIESNACSMFYPFRNKNYFPKAKKGDNFTDLLTEAAMDYISTKRDKPFFMYLAHFAMHAPIESKPELRKKFEQKRHSLKVDPADNQFNDLYSSLGFKKVQDEPEYAGELATLDKNIGRLVQHLKDLKLYDNTIIILTGDNGGRSSFFRAPPTSVYPMRGGKTFIFEGGLKTPLLIHWPGHTQGQHNRNTAVTSTDFYPTLLDMIGQPLKPDQHRDGQSLVPLIQGQTLQERNLYFHFPHYQGEGSYPASAILRGHDKLIYHYHQNDHLLFDLKNDPNESSNLFSTQPEKAKGLQAQLMTYLKSSGAKLLWPNPDYQPQN